MNAVTGLAIGSVKSHKLRSIVICTAVILTCVLFTTVVSIIYHVYGGAELILQLNAGNDFHISVSCRRETSAEKVLEAVLSDENVSEAFISVEHGAYDTDIGITGCRTKALSSAEACGHMFIHFTEGAFPSEGGVALNREKFPDAEIGDVIGFSKSTPIHERGEIVRRLYHELGKFTVTGFFECGADSGVCTDALIMYDESTDIYSLSSVSVKVSLTNGINIKGKLEGITDRIDKTPGTEGASAKIGEGYSGTWINAVTVLFALFLIAVIFFSSFLLIYNIYSIALTQDLRTFGLLGVIGTTHKQLRSLIRRQAMIYYILSAPVGLAAGYFIGWLIIAPTFMSLSSNNTGYSLHGFNTWVLIPTALLTLFTLLYSALRPLRMMKKLTPIEAVNAEVKKKGLKHRKPVEINPFSLAALSAVRGRKRLLISSLSAALSVTLFILISTLSGAIMEIGMSSMPVPDIIIYTSSTITAMYPDGHVETNTHRASASKKQAAVDPSVYEKVRAIEGFEYVYALKRALVDIPASEKVITAAEQMLAYYGEDAEYLTFVTALESAAEGKVKAIFISIPDELCKYIAMSNNESFNDEKLYTGSELYDGKHIIAANTYSFNYVGDSRDHLRSLAFSFYDEGDIISAPFLENEYSVIRSDLQVYGDLLGHITDNMSIDAYVQPLILPQSVFEREFADADTDIYAVVCSEKDGGILGSIRKTENEDRLGAEVNGIVASYMEENSAEDADSSIVYGIGVSGRFTERSKLRSQLNSLEVVGYTLAALIFLIGVINMVNSSLSAVTERRREYAMLEAVGMTGRQLRTMMLTEGFIGGAIAAAITLLAGTPMINMFMREAIHFDTGVDIVPAVVMLALLLVISAITSVIAYNEVRRAPMTDRLRLE